MSHTVWGKVLLTRPWGGTWLPLKLQFILNETNCAGLSYYHPVQRSYIGNYDFQNGRARGRIDLNGLDGMPRQGQVYYPLWNPNDGKFYTSLPIGAMPMEQVLGFWANVLSGAKKGVFYGDGEEGPLTFHKKVTPYGFIKFNSDQTAFRFIAKTDTGWEEQGVYRLLEGTAGLATVPNWHPHWGTSLYCYKNEWQRYEYRMFSFSGSGVSVSGAVCTPFQWNGYSIWQASPPFTVAGRQWFYISGVSQYGPAGTMRDDGEILYGSSPYPYPWEINYWQLPRSIRKYRYVLPPPPYGTYLAREIENEIFFSSFDDSVSMITALDDGADFGDAAISTFANWMVIKIRCGQPDHYYIRLLAFDHVNFTIVSQIDWRDFPQYEEPGCIRVYNNIPYAVTCLNGSHEPLLLNMLTGSFFDWRGVYLWNHQVYSSYVYGYSGQVGYVTSSCGLPRTGVDGTIAMEYWGDDQEEPGWSDPPCVLQGDVTVINPSAAGMYIAAGSVEEVSGCQTDYHKARATFTIKDTFDNQPVYGAEVECHVVARIVGQSPVYDQILTGLTDANGVVTFENPSCLYGGSGLEVFEIRFTVTEVFKAGVDYQESANVVIEVVFTHENLPTGTLTPDPAEWGSTSSPFQVLQSGTYYHVMASVVPTTNPANEPVEYKFTCVDNGTLTSTWRNADNVAGKFFPNGQPQTPHQYWVQVGIKNLMYRWKVQYRFKNNPSVIAAESPQKQITNTLP